ncbi:hypothetical protein [Burkholderia sp. Bp8986]|uniref:hypothetical protein n=1 Tax=Burkholderia sp. Bp8986 TaxID=2184550 RepID=UPI000F59F75A|nr:hypothetical protein [Burkholderia sp. Bp8986]
MNAKVLLEMLATDGVVEVPDTDCGRRATVGGIQWAMEASLRGTEYIVTPERPTPFRTHGEEQRAHGQAEREAGLIERVKRGDPLHLVFCREGVGTQMQDATYRREVLERFAVSGMLQEHYLEYSKDTFPAEHSGALIISFHDDNSFAFAIHAAQVDKTTNVKVIRLYLGALGSSRGQPVDKAFRDWESFLRKEGISLGSDIEPRVMYINRDSI